jgi:hypothetical protein
MTSPLPEALARLREEVRLAEDHLASLDGASMAEQLAAASSVHTRRRALTDTARGHGGRDVLAREAANTAGAQALADALLAATSGEPAEEPEPDPNPESDDPLASLFR